MNQQQWWGGWIPGEELVEEIRHSVPGPTPYSDAQKKLGILMSQVASRLSIHPQLMFKMISQKNLEPKGGFVTCMLRFLEDQEHTDLQGWKFKGD